MGSFVRGLLLLWGVLWLINLLRGPADGQSQPRRPNVVVPEGAYPPPGPRRRGPPLPPPSADDPVVMVEPETKRGASVGTAFAMHESGVWVTARHVVSDCHRLALRGRQGWSEVEVVWMHPRADMAIVRSGGAPTRLALSAADVTLAQDGYAVGYPQARPGAVHGHLLGRSRMRSPGLYAGVASTVAWAEVDRQPALSGSLGGISGGPMLDESGQVIGVIVAEVPRRGRFETLAPEVLYAAAARPELLPGSSEPPLVVPMNEQDFGSAGDLLRRRLGVALLGCSA